MQRTYQAFADAVCSSHSQVQGCQASLGCVSLSTERCCLLKVFRVHCSCLCLSRRLELPCRTQTPLMPRALQATAIKEAAASSAVSRPRVSKDRIVEALDDC